VRIHAGTSGFSYKEWKGAFYPETLPAKEMLSYYAGRLPAVEINNTFYRLPKAAMLEGWCAQVPEEFRFVLKASRRITHFKRLKEPGDETTYFLETAGTLGPRLGAALFQLPPNMKKDIERLRAFLAVLPGDVPATFEFRHESWFDDEVHDALRAAGVALCVADTDDDEAEVAERLVSTADWGYLRLRRSAYDDDALRRCLAVAHEQDWRHAFVFFKHEDEGTGPRLAQRLLELAADA
jgi:uncharacterized protein YecE (DUF72 family)